MADTTSKPPEETATVNLTELADRADALLAAWQGDDLPPDLAEFLPAGPSPLRHLVLTELVKIDLEYRWQHHELPKLVEEYAEEFPELAENGQIPCAVIYEEFHIRQQTEDRPTPEDYYQRFPAQRDALRRMLSLEPSRMTSTTLVAGGRGIDVEVGQQIDDFDLLVQLGKGSFGAVYLARQRSMQRIVALKISRDRGVEPQTLAQLDHPNIVRVYDQRVLAERRMQLMYMQHIPGGTLQEVVQAVRGCAPDMRNGKILLQAIDAALEKRGESPPAESTSRRRLSAVSWPEAVCWIGARLAAALDYAHARGVLHRDVKPANVLLAADGSPKLVDFNVSYSSKLDGSTPAAYFGGSLAYMSPEQLEATNPDHDREPHELDGRSDVYSLAVLLWELLTGTRPFGEDRMEGTWAETLKVLTDRRRFGLPPSALAMLPRDMPPGLQQVLTSCLSPNVEDRPATAGALARQLELCLQPRAQRLLQPRPKSIRERVQGFPFLFFVLVGLIPSVAFSFLNLEFNSREIIPEDRKDPIHQFFWKVQVPTINGVAFPIAVGVVFYFAWPVLHNVRRVKLNRPTDAAEFPRLRRRALWVGDCAAGLGMLLWIVSGIAFPFWLHMQFGDGAIQMQQYRNFLASQIICGLISSTLTFYLLTFMFVRGFYPMLIRPEQPQADEVNDLVRLERRSSRYVYLAFTSPLFAVMLLAFSGTKVQWATGGLAGIGVAVCIIAWNLAQTIRGDLAALAVALDPAHETIATGDGTESFWTASR